jgi:hypothetical protein
LGAKLQGPYAYKEGYFLSASFITYLSDIINLHKRVRDVPYLFFFLLFFVLSSPSTLSFFFCFLFFLMWESKSKQYIEASFDIAFDLMKQFSSVVLQDQELTFHFLNWAISMYILFFFSFIVLFFFVLFCFVVFLFCFLWSCAFGNSRKIRKLENRKLGKTKWFSPKNT